MVCVWDPRHVWTAATCLGLRMLEMSKTRTPRKRSLLTGVGTLFYAAVSFVELVVEGTVRGYFVRRRVKAEIDKLNDHYVLCGYGRVGRQVAREFATDGTGFVVVDQQETSVE